MQRSLQTWKWRRARLAYRAEVFCRLETTPGKDLVAEGALLLVVDDVLLNRLELAPAAVIHQRDEDARRVLLKLDVIQQIVRGDSQRR